MTARTPQTFEEWCRAWWKANGWTSGPPQGLYSSDSLRAAWNAALASQQAKAQAVEDAYWTWRNCRPEQECDSVEALEVAIDHLTTSEDKGR